MPSDSGTTEPSPLDGLRVVDLTGDIGRFASKLLVEFGADVVRVTDAGSSGRALQHQPAGGVLDWWYDGGKRTAVCDLSTTSGIADYRRLAQSADVILESTRPGHLAELGIDHTDLVVDNPTLTQVSITPFGRTGPWRDWVSSDLVNAALGGVLQSTGLPERPLNLWGRQSWNFAGFTAAISALAGVQLVRRTGRGRHFDVSAHEAVTGSIEHIFMQYFFDEEMPTHDKVAPRQAALHWLRIYDLAQCADGHAMITFSPHPAGIVGWMRDEGVAAADQFATDSRTDLLDRAGEVMALIAEFVRSKSRAELWDEAQRRHTALAMVNDVADAAASPQFAHRRFFSNDDVPMPSRLARFSRTTTRPPAPPGIETSVDQVIGDWRTRTAIPDANSGAPGLLTPPLDGVRIADFTWVLAGPMATRLLGDLGADVIRVQHEQRASSVNRPESPFYFCWNRSKRGVTLNVRHPDGLAAARRLVESADVVIENFSAGVFASWGLDWETMHEWNPRLIYVTMAGCGHDGPWRHVISYAPTVHALTGMTHLTGFEDRGGIGPGFSVADHVAGFSASTVVLAALEERERSGLGQMIDLAQIETAAYAIGPAFIEHLANGDAPQPAGNRDGLQDHVPNELYRSADEGWLAVTACSDDQFHRLASVVGNGLDSPEYGSEVARRAHRDDIDAIVAEWVRARSGREAMVMLQAAGVPAGVLQTAAELHGHDPQLADRGFWQDIDHGLFGPRPVDRFPALINSERPVVERGSPAYFGEHNFEVWAELGMSPEEIADAMASGLFS